MNEAFLSAPPPEPIPGPPTDTRRLLALESLDGAQRIQLDGEAGWWLMDGATGLEMPPFEVVTTPVPGVHGSVLDDVRASERQVFVPIYTVSSHGAIDHLRMLSQLRTLVDPLTGEFRIVGATATSERLLTCIYTGGLEGAGGRDAVGRYWRTFGFTATACDPWARARNPRVLEFDTVTSSSPFIGVEGGTDAPWPTALSTTVVIGSGMTFTIDSEVPVYPTLELDGPMDSFTGTMASGWSVSVPTGVPAGSTLKIVTDPRARSIRLDGALAAGRVERGSQLTPFQPGENTLDVAAPGGTDDTRLRLSWTEAFRSLW